MSNLLVYYISCSQGRWIK